MSDDKLDQLGTVVIPRYGTGTEGEAAEIVSICDAPSFTLVPADGRPFSWRQDLTRAATRDEELAYWKERARTEGRRG